MKLAAVHQYLTKTFLRRLYITNILSRNENKHKFYTFIIIITHTHTYCFAFMSLTTDRLRKFSNKMHIHINTYIFAVEMVR